MQRIIFTAEDKTNEEIVSKEVFGEIGNLEEYMNSKMLLFGEYQHMFPESRKAFTDIDMCMESGGYFIGIEFKKTMQHDKMNLGQYLFAKNLAKSGAKIIYYFVFGSLTDPQKYFTVENTGDGVIQTPITDIPGGLEEFKDILRKKVKWTEKHSLIGNDKDAMFDEAKAEIKHLFYDYYGV